jgi:hypothetical protein
METMIKIEDVFRPARKTTPAGSMPAKEDNDAGREIGRFLSLGSSHISMIPARLKDRWMT